MLFFFWSQHHLYTWLWDKPVISAILVIFYLVQFISPSNSCFKILICTVLFLFRFFTPFSSSQKQSFSESLISEFAYELDLILSSYMHSLSSYYMIIAFW